MKLKKTIQVVEYSNIALIIASFLLVFLLISKSKEGGMPVFEALVLMPFILAFFFRKLITSIYLKKSDCPGVFYSVMEKLGLSQNL